jgi:two-component system chemotaxis response regulator CheB
VTSNSQIAVGAQNIQVARRLLSTLGLPIAKEDVGSLQGRRVVVEAHSGTAWIKRLERTHTEDLPVTRDTHILALGASTGGTQALQDILMALPSGLPPIVVVQHMPEDFTGGFAEALSRVCAFPVNEPKQGELLQPGRAYLAPGNLHMRVKSGERGLWFDLRNDPLVNGFRPSVDVLFDSLKSVPRKVIAGLLTGMGHDGARGLLELRKIGARTVAQDESTSVVYGMPKAAADLGAAEKILPLPEIAPFFLRCLSKPNSKAA